MITREPERSLKMDQQILKPRGIRIKFEFNSDLKKSRFSIMTVPQGAALWAFVLVFLSCGLNSLRASENDALRAEEVRWERLKTPSEYWYRHASADPVLMRYLRDQTTLNIDRRWYIADVEKLDEMCRYPLLFSQGIGTVTSPTGGANIAEYMKRGGFLLIDACIGVTRDSDLFFKEQKQRLNELLPEARIAPIPNDDVLYHCFYTITGGPPHTFNDNIYDKKWAQYGLYGIWIGNRMAGLISLSGLQCGWDKMIAPPGHDILCMRMLVNIYIYAMMQQGS